MHHKPTHLPAPKRSSTWLPILLLIIALPNIITACKPSTSSTPSSKNTVATTPTQQHECSTSTSSSSPSTAKDQTLYVGDATFTTPPLKVSVYALNASSGTKVWQTTVAQQGGAIEGQSLQVVDGVVYVAHVTTRTLTVDGVTALDAKNGHVIWQYKTDDQTSIASMVVCNGAIYLGTGKSIEARQAKDARLLWRYTSVSLVDKPMITNDTAYVVTVTFKDEKKCRAKFTPENCVVLSIIHALRSSDGKERWHSSPYTDADIPVRLTATDQVVYAVETVGRINEVDALRASDGALLWHRQVGIEGGIGQAAVINGILYLSALSQLVALRASDGQQLWFHTGAYLTELHAGDGGIYTTGDNDVGNFCALDATSGKTLWCSKLPNTGSVTAASEGVVYTAANFAGTVHALRKSDGGELWHYESENDHRVFGLGLG